MQTETPQGTFQVIENSKTSVKLFQHNGSQMVRQGSDAECSKPRDAVKRLASIKDRMITNPNNNTKIYTC